MIKMPIPEGTQSIRRRRFGVAAVAATVVGAVAAAVSFVPQLTSAAPAPPAAEVIYPIQQFPVQGPCAFIDTYGAPRSGGRTHEGVDIIARTGLALYAVSDGTLTRQYTAATAALAGNGWKLTKPDGTYFFYAHLSDFAPGLAVGSKVVAGQTIGYVGATGNAGSPHLHFEIHPLGGSPINPTASVRAVDGCKITTPVVPGSTIPATIPPVTNPVITNPPATVVPTTPTTAPRVIPPPQTIPVSSRPDVVVGGAGAFRSLGLWQFTTPITVLKSSTNNVVGGVTKRVPIAGVAGLNPASTGALVRASAYGSSSGSLLIHACNEPPASTTTMTVSPTATAYASTAVRVTNGEICVTSSASAGVRIEVLAQLDANGVGAQAIATTRGFDSRVSGRLAANVAVPVSLAALGVPANATAVTAAVAIVGSAVPGVLSVGPCGTAPWQAAFIANATTSIGSVIQVNSAGLCVTSSVAADVIVDVSGYFAKTASMLSAVASTRKFDSRSTGQQIGATPTPVLVANSEDFSASTPRAQLSFTLIGGATEASVFAWPCDQPQPPAVIGVVRARSVNTVSALIGLTNGTLCLASTQPVHVIVDVVAFGS
jgi:Peptidase family M23